MNSILERAIQTVIERLKYLEEHGSFTPNDEWTLKHLSEALQLYQLLEKPLKPLDLKHDLPTTIQESTSTSFNDGC